MSRISVIMGVYRPDRAMLTYSIRSVLDQDMPGLELIVCDDGSQDQTFEFLTKWAENEPRLKILRHGQNRGLAAALNTCLDCAGGEYIARQDADDLSVPGRFAAQSDFLDANPGLCFVGSAVRLFGGSGVWAVKAFPELPQKRDFLFAVPFSHGSLMFRGNLLKKHRYRVDRFTRRAEDYELLMRMYADGCFGANLTEPYYDYRDGGGMLSSMKYRRRMDAAVIRAKGFYRLGLYPAAIPYVIKPLIVGLIPLKLLNRLKRRHYRL
ncbi:MAG: glycosyltransferase [Oscillospiraceae bacterium]|nr:glycosyltransferase [Oscillospiraceae bacterium]